MAMIYPVILPGEEKSESEQVVKEKVSPRESEVGVENSPKESNSHQTLKNVKNSLIVFGIIALYVNFGAWIFRLLEQKADVDNIRHLRKVVLNGRSNLTSAILELGLLSYNGTDGLRVEKLTKAIQKYESILDSISEKNLKPYFTNETIPIHWDYSRSILFVLILITTIGYGDITPKTNAGRVFCILYALIGIPLMLIAVAKSGKVIAHVLGQLLKIFLEKFNLRKPLNKHLSRFYSSDAPYFYKIIGTILAALTLVISLFIYLSIGAWIYDQMEHWGFINSFYFCFITLTTIGFGDMIPDDAIDKDAFFIVRFLYVLFGLAVTSTVIELARSHYSNSWSHRKRRPILTRKIGMIILGKS